ncbi:KpsF/GutQ family sugar-phosphate isomerase [Zoogloea dura]|jgi:arabinose-5-phosphate isomerase|uniref:KpsF/GutQ family sugar-phosphate isomerase n=1 Tax=Zoogloea dura TaxID=2728840 RepID=A0A848G731_9RHOO|nr:KpsF/GutQ family sugar-phosphate isomerase [Zoogloea dura]NML28037.1 KpsF/GutQ family sugar-phosphate isomerase [Zoogloea dura]
MSSAPLAAAHARVLDLARRVLSIEAEAVQALAGQLDETFTRAVDLILASPGRVIVSGIGKTGHIGRKFAATLASTGTPAYFVHAAEAAHGDLGMITADDVLVAISYSGSSEELLKIVPLVKRQGAHLIALTGNPDSPLAREADVHLNGAVREEACPLNLAPTASTTAALALSDALAVALLDARGFGPDDFARSHPGGALGRRLLTHVSDVMRSGGDVPRVAEEALLADALMEMTRAGLGMTAIVDAHEHIVGIYTDGDLRRSLASGCNFSTARIADVMSRKPKTIHAGALAVEAAEMMERLRISELLVAGPDGKLVGALNHHDLMRAKVI